MKHLYIFVSHLDDIEISTYGYIFKHQHEYTHINIIIATTWQPKVEPWQKNLEVLTSVLPCEITYLNLEFQQRTLNTNLDQCKDKFYSIIDFDSTFDILTHDSNDAHTDHTAVYRISRGLHKMCNRFLTIYSPSSIDFKCNYYIKLEPEVVSIKQRAMSNYNHGLEQSYTNNDYYFHDEWAHKSVPTARVVENFTTSLLQHASECEVYNIIKWV